jgi:ComF family protein
MIESWRDGVACAQCWQEVEWAGPDDTCAKCGLLLPPLSAHLAPAERRCGRCEQWAFASARACGPYQGALRESVLWLKRHPHLAPRLRQSLRAAFAAFAAAQASEAIIPVPLHPTRLNERGFNQAEVIAHALAAATGLAVDTASLVRVKATEPHRAGMGALERARSLQEAFHVRAPRLIEHRVVLLVDDVMTTATTAHEVAQALLAGGARAVNVLTLARAVSHFD